jgi:hypothetical protein
MPVYLKATLVNPKEKPLPEKIITLKDNIQKSINIGMVEP